MTVVYVSVMLKCVLCAVSVCLHVRLCACGLCCTWVVYVPVMLTDPAYICA